MGGKASKKPPKDPRPAFRIYTEKEGRNGCLTRSGFKNWLCEGFIISQDSEVTVIDVEEVLAANIGEKNVLNFDEFKKCIEDIAKKKKMDRTQLMDRLISAAEATL